MHDTRGRVLRGSSWVQHVLKRCDPRGLVFFVHARLGPSERETAKNLALHDAASKELIDARRTELAFFESTRKRFDLPRAIDVQVLIAVA